MNEDKLESAKIKFMDEVDKYLEIINNAYQWYQENASPIGSFNLLIKILQENNIL